MGTMMEKYCSSNHTPIELIMIYISISKHPDQELMVSIVQPSKGDSEGFPHWAHQSLLSQRGCYVTMLKGPHAITMATIGPGPFRGKATPSNLGPPALYIRMALSPNMCQGLHDGSNTATQEYTDYNLIWKENT